MVIRRALIVGLGSIGKRHARVLRQLLPDVELAVLRHGGGDAADVPGAHCFHALAEAVAFAPDLAVLANPSPFHVETALALAKAGAHLLVEKPLAAASGGVADLIALCRQRQRVLMTAYNLRFLPSLQRLREALAAARIGRVLHVRAEVGQYLPHWRPGADYRNSVTANRALGGGVLLELSHELDYLRWLFGDIDWVSAVLRRQSALAIDVEDLAALQLGFVQRDGHSVVASVTLDCFRHDTTRQCTVIGDAGTLRWNAVTGELLCYQLDSGWQTLSHTAPVADESYIAEWQHFLACIARGSQPLVSGEDGLAVVQLVEAARRSAAEGRVVTMNRQQGA